MKIYLAGSVPKGDRESKNFRDWRKEYATVLQKKLVEVDFFDPSIFYKFEGNSLAVIGADCNFIQQSNLVIINAEEKLGAGTAMEFVIAKYFTKPVITVLPRNTHHRKSNLQFEGRLVEDWIHPFIETFSDVIIESINEISRENIKIKDIKDIKVIDSAIAYSQQFLTES